MKYEFNELDIRKQSRYANQGFKLKEHIGIDTETFHGYVKLITDSTGEFKVINNFSDIFNFLTSTRFRGKYNWFYNIQFDFDSIIKFLPREEVIKLYENNTLLHNKSIISYIPKKYFGIKDTNNNYYHFYDLFNFLEISLDKASKKYLKDEKLHLVEVEKLNIDKQYWIDNIDLITQYCLKDAKLTAQLAEYFWNFIYKAISFNPKKPFSKGRLAEEYFLNRCSIPTIDNIPMKVLKIAYEHYKGGRFEILKRGYQPIIYEYDIKSAYPSIIAELIDYSRGQWKYVKEYDNTDLGFFKCIVSCCEEYISPLVMKMGGLSIYPNGNFKTILTNNEIETINKLFPEIDLNITSGYTFRAVDEYYPFKEEIEKLYKLKEQEKDEELKYALKITLNALYGKFIQTVDKRTGKLFNPIYATLITSQTQLKLLELVAGHFNDIIAFSTDSVHSSIPLPVPTIPKMGDFALSFKGAGVYAMSDIYSLWNTNKESKNRFRGFMIKEGDKHTTLLNILKEMKGKQLTTYKYKVIRPKHLGECLISKSKYDLTDVNVFFEEERQVDFNGDKKRVWDRSFSSADDVLFNSINSKPIIFL